MLGDAATRGVSRSATEGVNLRSMDSCDLIDSAQKKSTEMYSKLVGILPSAEARKTREDAERKSILCKLLSSLLETKKILTQMGITTAAIDSQIDSTMTKLSK